MNALLLALAILAALGVVAVGLILLAANELLRVDRHEQ